MNWFKKRAAEPSTWVGLGLLVQALVAVRPDLKVVADVVTVVCGAAGAVIPEKG